MRIRICLHDIELYILYLLHYVIFVYEDQIK